MGSALETQKFCFDHPISHYFALVFMRRLLFTFFHCFCNHPLSYPIGIYSICSITQCDTHSGILLISFTYLNVFFIVALLNLYLFVFHSLLDKYDVSIRLQLCTVLRLVTTWHYL